jgi:DNA-binding NtrC family response regulator
MYEKHLIELVLEKNDWNVARAAYDMQILRTTLIYKIKKYGLTVDGSGNGNFQAMRHGFLNLDGPINW